MRFAFTDTQRAFQTTVREFLEKECSPADVRAAWESSTGRAPERWRALADLGVLGMTAPETSGGLGMDDVDLILLSEEAGRACLPEPLLEHTAVAIPLLRDHAPDHPALSDAVRGDVILTAGIENDATVSDAHLADVLVLSRDGRTHAIDRRDVTLVPQPSMDRARRLFSVAWEPRPATLLTDDPRAIADALDRGALHAAAQLLGIGARAIEMAASYALERSQFGVAIGSFQAVKHLLADALMQVEFARPVVYRAAWSMARGDAGEDVSMAKAAASDATVAALRASLQVHGAIGYTSECDLHLWLARGFALAGAWGDAARHRARVRRAVLGD